MSRCPYNEPMAYRYKERYVSVIGKRRWLQSEGSYSVPDEAGSRVAILVPFIAALVQDPRDSRQNFETQTAALVDQYVAKDRDPHFIMGATPEDFEQVLADASIPTVVVTGFGNFSAVATPLSRDMRQANRYGYLDWLHLAGMATHLKFGEFVMMQCGGFNREFNPPLGCGVVHTFSNISAATGKARYATDIGGEESPVKQITTENELTYRQVRELFPLQRNWDVPPLVPDPAYVAALGVYNHLLNRNMPDIPRPEPIPYPDLRRYLA